MANAIVTKVNDKNVINAKKDIMLVNEDDFDNLPTMTSRGTISQDETEFMYTYQDINEPCGVDSMAYLQDYSVIKVLGLDNEWHTI